MKTLLLTLVVVTIVCLDLGYTLVCIKDESIFPGNEKCLYWQKVCYKRWYLGRSPTRGCDVTCPRKLPLENVECCSTDFCNR
uniref:Three-finger toxin n=1 Tax=Calliophis bivirgatus TaxID=8633 RepID=A0A898IN70_CALBG|nr:three-finger toxin [Calliophis bivirgatus]